MLLLEHVSILLSKLNDCPNNDTLSVYCNYPFLTVRAGFTLCHRLWEKDAFRAKFKFVLGGLSNEVKESQIGVP